MTTKNKTENIVPDTEKQDMPATPEENTPGFTNNRGFKPPRIAVVLVVLLIGLLIVDQLFYMSLMVKPRWIMVKTDSGIKLMNNPELMALKAKEIEKGLFEAVTPAEGVAIPVKWADIGKRMVEAGVIDKEKFYSLHESKGDLGPYERGLLEKEDNGHIMINSENANAMLNILWALGLANKNSILEEGPMTDERYGGDAGKFASTGGWSLAKGNAMNHYSKHNFVVLTDEQQKLTEEVSKNIYRPCCGNSTHFPDCNHGMAMLGLMELMASQGATKQEMYDAALAVNSFWFPDTYITIGKYFAKRGVEWQNIDSKEVLGASYSSGQGYAQIAQEVEPVQSGGSGSCGV